MVTRQSRAGTEGGEEGTADWEGEHASTVTEETRKGEGRIITQELEAKMPHHMRVRTDLLQLHQGRLWGTESAGFQHIH